ncbi:MAG: CpcT/CpeT family chromophore lyase [Leptolyngbyaceae cyanobacterium]
MDRTRQLNQLGQHLAGVFQNRQQALENPAQYVHLRLWICPVALFTEDSHTFFMEQASAAFAQPPYRQRLLRVRYLSESLTAEYYAFKKPQAFQGAAQATEKLTHLTEADLQSLSGSRLQITSHVCSDAKIFKARQNPGELCQFTIDGQTKYVELGFDVVVPTRANQKPARFLMYDKGINRKDGKPIWGALQGPFQLEKINDLSALR